MSIFFACVWLSESGGGGGGDGGGGCIGKTLFGINIYYSFCYLKKELKMTARR